MSAELQDLLNYVAELKQDSLIKKVAFMVLKYSDKRECIVLAQTLLPESIEIDLWELESLVHPDKFEFPEPNIGQINVENESTI